MGGLRGKALMTMQVLWYYITLTRTHQALTEPAYIIASSVILLVVLYIRPLLTSTHSEVHSMDFTSTSKLK